jgi:hypothetical protein
LVARGADFVVERCEAGVYGLQDGGYERLCYVAFECGTVLVWGGLVIRI